MSSKPLYIFGAGGHAREVLQIVKDINASAPSPQWHLMGFLLDDGYHLPSTHLNGLPVLQGPVRWGQPAAVVIAIGQSAARKEVVRRLQGLGYSEFPTMVHPLAWMADTVVLGSGNVIFSGVLLNTDVTLGDHVHVNLGCSISHDGRIGSYSTLGPGTRICGHCVTAEGTDIGAGCTLIPKASIGEWSIIGAGAVVTGDIAANATAVGVPATVIKTRPQGWHAG
ncbi:MAG: acetyltransferase [Leptothrix sp. (in: b-proteobacteria)]